MKSGIARYIIKNYIIYKDLEKNTTIKSKENLLDIVFNSNEKNLFLNDLIESLFFCIFPYLLDNGSISP